LVSAADEERNRFLRQGTIDTGSANPQSLRDQRLGRVDLEERYKIGL